MKSSEFKQIVMPLSTRLFRLANRLLNNREEAEDVVQETFLKLWGMRQQLGNYRSIEALAVSIVKNLSIDLLRKHKRELEKKKEFGIDQVSPANVLNEMILAERNEGLLKMIGNLPEPQRTLLQMRHLEGFSYEEISEKMEMNVNAIRVSISRARMQLREMMVKNFETWKV